MANGVTSLEKRNETIDFVMDANFLGGATTSSRFDHYRWSRIRGYPPGHCCSMQCTWSNHAPAIASSAQSCRFRRCLRQCKHECIDGRTVRGSWGNTCANARSPLASHVALRSQSANATAGPPRARGSRFVAPNTCCTAHDLAAPTPLQNDCNRFSASGRGRHSASLSNRLVRTHRTLATTRRLHPQTSPRSRARHHHTQPIHFDKLHAKFAFVRGSGQNAPPTCLVRSFCPSLNASMHHLDSPDVVSRSRSSIAVFIRILTSCDPNDASRRMPMRRATKLWPTSSSRRAWLLGTAR